MSTRSNPGILRHDSGAARRVVCFGMITPARVLVVDELPEWNVAMAGTLMVMLPPIVVVLVLQRWFVKGLLGGEK